MVHAHHVQSIHSTTTRSFNINSQSITINIIMSSPISIATTSTHRVEETSMLHDPMPRFPSVQKVLHDLHEG